MSVSSYYKYSNSEFNNLDTEVFAIGPARRPGNAHAVLV